MPRSRGSELPQQRASPRAPLHLKTTACSDANGSVHHRPGAASSPKLDDRRSPRSAFHEKKRGTQVADLETKLKKAQEELKKLREQLASAESAKTDAQAALEEAKKRVALQSPPPPPPSAPTPPSLTRTRIRHCNWGPMRRRRSATHRHGDDQEVELGEEAEKMMMIVEKNECAEKKNGDDGYAAEAAELRERVAEKEKEIEAAAAENAELKKAAEAAGARIRRMEEELRDSRERVGRFVEEVEAAEGAKEAAEAEVRRLKVQAEQWRKAAEAAAAMLAAADEGAVGRCGSMDKHLVAGGSGYGWGSPAVAIGEEAEEEGGRRQRRARGSGGGRG
uniref:Uncharacterized protein n=1 Tax=Ananas comosus var. bracteatus TaxID=296719 RepID=A0A6V7NYX6_ANACO|nr:unnamed protein product [Ananas comosus var. bracteatus]